MIYIIDRIEECFAVCEDEEGDMVNLELSKLPIDVKEGDVLIENAGIFEISREETEKRKAKIKEKMNKLWK